MGRLDMHKLNLSKIKAQSWARNAAKLKLPVIKRAKAAHQKESSPKPAKRFKQGWRDVAGRKVFFRSAWEANFGRYLQWQKERKEILEWHHEPKTFWFEGIKRGCVTYLPDFQVIALDGSHEWIEVKGFMDAKSRTKINRFRKFFPKEKLRIVNSKWYNQNSKKLSLIIPQWERG